MGHPPHWRSGAPTIHLGGWPDSQGVPHHTFRGVSAVNVDIISQPWGYHRSAMGQTPTMGTNPHDGDILPTKRQGAGEAWCNCTVMICGAPHKC